MIYGPVSKQDDVPDVLIDALGHEVIPLEKSDPELADMMQEFGNEPDDYRWRHKDFLAGRSSAPIAEGFTRVRRAFSDAVDNLFRPSPGSVVRKTEKVGRNDPCTCGSGKKFKKCCIGS